MSLRPSAPAAALPDDAPHVLVVDDDTRIRSLLSRFLREHGYRVTTAEHAEEARTRLESLSFDLIVLDVMMPGENGFEFTRRVRRTSAIPILMLTARTEVADRLMSFEAGADDYLAKPFEPKELLARINSILRRVASAPPKLDQAVESVHFGPFVFHLERGELRRGEEVIRITERERDMLRLLSEKPGDTLHRDTLAEQNTDGGSERTVDVQITRLRRKIETDPANPTFLQTVRGIGYRLQVD